MFGLGDRDVVLLQLCGLLLSTASQTMVETPLVQGNPCPAEAPAWLAALLLFRAGALGAPGARRGCFGGSSRGRFLSGGS